MAFDWLGYLSLAERLLSQPEPIEEADLRTAISRAYYCAFNLAAARLDIKDPAGAARGQYHGYGSHEQAWRTYSRGGNTMRSIALSGRKLKRWREAADYDDSPPVARDRVIASIRAARAILSELRYV